MTFEKYALNEYYKHFDDEKHWLIVLSVNPYDHTQWDFEGIIGDHTSKAIRRSLYDVLNDSLQESFENKKSFGKSFSLAFNKVAQNMRKIVSVSDFVFIIIVIFYPFIALWNAVNNYQPMLKKINKHFEDEERKRIEAEEAYKRKYPLWMREKEMFKREPSPPKKRKKYHKKRKQQKHK